MKLPSGARRWLTLPKRLADVARQIDDELDFHIESRTEEFMRQGLPRAAARARALQEFGDMQEARAELGAIDSVQVARKRRAEWWSGLGQDVKYAWRGVRRQPGFAVIIVLTLALGLGANATTFELVDRLLFRAPEHVAAPEALRRVYFHETNPWSGPSTYPATTYPDFLALQKNSKMMEISAYMGTEGTLGRGRESQKITFMAASANMFRVLGVRPHLGRFYTDKEDGLPHGERVVVLDYDFWQRHYSGARDVLGKQVLIGRSNFTIVGVAPRGFTGMELKQMDVWVPASVIAEEWGGPDFSTMRNMTFLRLVGRLRPGVSAQQAEQEATSIWLAASARNSDSTAKLVLGPVQQARGAWESEETRNGRVAGWLAGVSLLVLLVACANVANLLLTRALRLRRETGLRLALGIGRTRLLRAFLVESLLFAILSALAAFLLSHWGSALLRTLFFTNIAWNRNGIDERLIVFLLVAVGFTTIAIMLPPAVQMLRDSIIPALKSGPRSGQARSRLRTSLLFLQAVFSVMLLVGAALFVRSFYNVTTMNLGFDPRHVLLAEIDLGLLDYKRDQRNQFYEAARDRIAALPGVRSAAIGTSAPFYSSIRTDVYADGHDTIRAPGDRGPFVIGVTPDYFKTLDTRIIRGRGFTDQDRAGAPNVAVVNETMARLLWPGQEAIGKCLYVGERREKPPCSRIVGVAEEIKSMALNHDQSMTYYLPFAQRGQGLLALFIRTSGEPMSAMRPIQQAIHAGGANLPYANVKLLQDFIDPHMRSWKLGAALFSVFGVLALLLAGVGLYSALSHAVASRTTEVGVRMALGARATDVVGMIVRDGMTVAVAGVATGVLLSLAASRYIAELLFDVTPRDPLSYSLAAAILLAVALLAVLLPARRATRVDPAVALKAE
jgi:putative ABC transport system permease protein